jgi:hypothetical protein
VWSSGDLFKGRIKTIFGTQTPQLNAQGETKMEYGLGLAVPKTVLTQAGAGQPGEIWSAIHEEAYTLFPSKQIPPSFAMKYKDGDGIDDQGRSFAEREGYAGCLVFACTTSLPIKFFKWENGANVLINEGIKVGDYVNVQLNVKAHAAVGAGKAGLYLNPVAVQFLGYGKEIVNAPSGNAIFGAAAPAVPLGASATPLAPQPGQMLVPPVAPTPNYGVVPPQFQPVTPTQLNATAAMTQQTPVAMPQFPGVPR